MGVLGVLGVESKSVDVRSQQAAHARLLLRLQLVVGIEWGLSLKTRGARKEVSQVRGKQAAREATKEARAKRANGRM